MCHFMLVQARTRLPLVDETDFSHSQKSPLPGIEPGTSSTAMGRSTHCATGAVYCRQFRKYGSKSVFGKYKVQFEN